MRSKPSFLHRCFGAPLWDTPTLRLWLCMVAVILWFDVEWCLATTFTAFSMPETWVNTLLLSLLLSMLQMLWGMRRSQAVLTLLVAVWLECNLMYSRTYFSAIPLGSYAMAGNLADFTASVVDSLRWLDLLFLIPVIAAFTVALRSPGERKRPVPWLPYLFLTSLLLIASGALLSRRGGLTAAWRSLANANYHSCRVPMYTLVGSMVNDGINAVTPISDAQRRQVSQWFDFHESLTQPAPDSIGRDNIVLILCESLESWPIGLTVEGKEITPCLNRLVADSTTFFAPNVLSQVGAGRSIDGQLLVNAGMLPMLTGVYATDCVNNRYHTLSEALAIERGARSYLLTVDKASTWNQQAVARAFAIDTIIPRDCWVNDEKVGSRKKLGDRSFARQIVERMKLGEIWPAGERAFLQIVTYSGHNPFILPEALDSLKLEGKGLPPTVLRYLTMAHYTDQAIGILTDYLASRPDYARTMVVITGDHEGLASERRALSDACSFVSPLPMVPLIVANAPVAKREERVMGQVDIYPTLLDLAALRPQWRGMGISALSHAFPGVAIGSQLEIMGDTAAVSPEIINHLRLARGTSDCVITFDLLDKQ